MAKWWGWRWQEQIEHSLSMIFNGVQKIMADVAKLQETVDNLQKMVDAEQEQIKKLVDSQLNTIAELTKLLEEAKNQQVPDSIITQIESTIADIESTVNPEPTPEG